MEESVAKELGTRAKRWISMNKSMCLHTGKFKPEIRQRKSVQGWNTSDIDKWESKFTKELEELRRLDETAPEPWINYTAYDFFTEDEKKYFNPDGTLREHYFLEASGSFDYWIEMSRRKILEVNNYNSVSARKAAEGQNHGQWLMDCRRSRARNYAKNMKQQRQDMRNNEEVSSLPFDVDPDSYF